jgi:hypothetical protein
MNHQSVSELTKGINAFIEKEGVTGLMPTMKQFENAGLAKFTYTAAQTYTSLSAIGLTDLVNGINMCGGIMRASKMCRLLMIIPKSRKGAIQISLPPLRFGQKKEVIKLELTEELKGRIDAIRTDKEYQKRKACHDLGRDLFVEEAQKAVQAAGIVRQPSAAAVTEAKAVVAAEAVVPAVKVVVAQRLTSRQLKRPVVLLAGGTDWDRLGKADKADGDDYNLATPHVVAALNSVRVHRIATSNSSAHCIAITESHQCFVWGRNECGQLGLGHTESVATPTLMKACKEDIVAASCGKEHSVFITAAGGVLSAGSKERAAIGQWQPGGKPNFACEVQLGEECVDVSCGTDFTLVLTKKGAVWSFGWSENGCLGHGDDGCFNQSASSIKLTFSAEKQAKRIAALMDSTIVQVSAGARHCAALADDGKVFTWGCGDYGRLGHQKQEDVSVAIVPVLFKLSFDLPLPCRSIRRPRYRISPHVWSSAAAHGAVRQAGQCSDGASANLPTRCGQQTLRRCTCGARCRRALLQTRGCIPSRRATSPVGLSNRSGVAKRVS